MGITYAIVNERNDVIKRHSNVITIWRTSVIEVTALLKKLRSGVKAVQEKESVMSMRGRLKNPSLAITVTSLGKPRDARQRSSGRTDFSIYPLHQ